MANDISVLDELTRDIAEHLNDVRVPSGGAVFVKDLTGIYVGAFATFEGRFQLQKSDMVGRDDAALFSPEVAPLLRVTDERVVEQRTAVSYEHCGELRGQLIVYRVVKLPVLDSDGDIHGVCGVGVDVTAEVLLRARSQGHPEPDEATPSAPPAGPLKPLDSDERELPPEWQAVEQFLRKRCGL